MKPCMGCTEGVIRGFELKIYSIWGPQPTDCPVGRQQNRASLIMCVGLMGE